MEQIGNFTSQANRDFPLDCETLDMMQRNTALVAALGNIAGDKLILSGCEPTGNAQRNAGYVFVRTQDYPQGEVLYWEGGAVAGGMYLRLDDVPVNTQGYEYPKAYTKRTLAPGVGSENFSWDDFTKPSTPAELEKQIADLKKQLDEATGKSSNEPLGIVKMWAGTNVPADYALCDGANLKIDEYPELYAAIGTAFNTAKNHNGVVYTTQSGYFRLPDLQGRFIVGYSDEDEEYQTYGNTGGEKKHTLTIEEMPSHSHSLWLTNSGTRYTGGGSDNHLSNGSGATGPTGGDASHENRPPYYVLAYIIKVR